MLLVAEAAWWAGDTLNLQAVILLSALAATGVAWGGFVAWVVATAQSWHNRQQP